MILGGYTMLGKEIYMQTNWSCYSKTYCNSRRASWNCRRYFYLSLALYGSSQYILKIVTRLAHALFCFLLIYEGIACSYH